MLVIKTIEELRSIGNLESMAILSFQRKKLNEHHSGHTYLVNQAKTIGNVVVKYWDHAEYMDFVFGDIDSDYHENINPTWDRNYCLSWCRENNVDIVWIPDPGYMSTYLGENNITNILSEVDEVWKNENYDDSFKIYTHKGVYGVTRKIEYRIKGWILSNYIEDKKWTYVGSWKDGSIVFVMKHFLEKYTTSKYVLVEPIKREDDLYMSTSMDKISNNNIEIIHHIPLKLNEIGYKDLNILANELNKLDSRESKELKIYKILVFDNPIIYDKILIEVYFQCNDVFDIFPFQISR